MQILIAIIALSFLIIVHEFGHFIVAKMSGIKVLEFALFMGPKLFSVQKGETLYSIRAVPLGGFVRMEGEEEASDDARAYNKKPLPIRAAVIAAGPVMNLLTAVIIVSLIYSFTGYNTNELMIGKNSPAQKAGLQNGDRLISYDGKKVFHSMDLAIFLSTANGRPAEVEVLRDGEKLSRTLVPEKTSEQVMYLLGFIPKDQEPEGADSNVVRSLSANSGAEKAGLQPNDRIIRLNGTPVSNRKQIADFMGVNKDKPVSVTVDRNGMQLQLPQQVTPTVDKIPEQYNIGIGFKSEKGSVIKAVESALGYTASITRSVYYSVAWLITGKVSVKQLMGPVGIVTTIGDVVQQNPTFADKLLGLLAFTSFISVNLGVFNLIPFPALDGSKLLLIAIEGIRRKAIPPEKEAYISMVGLVLLIMLMLFATSNDILRLLGKG